ncbi:MAG TPA: flagellar motor switch protein FliG [Tissierellaceae bacterium]
MDSEISGVRKAAILLIALGPETSSQILKSLPDSLIQAVTYEIANIEYVSPEERELVVGEFMEMAAAKEFFLDGGIDYAKDLLTKALGGQRAKEVIDILTQAQQKERPFAIARKADPQRLTNVLINEHPQVIALIMCYMQPDKAAIVLSEFPLDLQSEVAERIGKINRTSPVVIKQIEEILESKFSGFIDGEVETIGGVKSLVEILNSVDRSTEKNIIGVLESKEPDLAEEVKANLFVFEDIINLDKNSIQRILREIDNDDLILALKGASEEVSDLIYANMSQRAGEMIREDLQFMGPVRLSAVEEAQQKIVAIIRMLDEAGEILMGRGDQDSVVL